LKTTPASRPERTHACKFPGCTKTIPTTQLLCQTHWRLVPKDASDAYGRVLVRWKERTATEEEMRSAAHMVVTAAAHAIRPSAITPMGGAAAIAAAPPASPPGPPPAELVAFARLVAQMRRAQRAYFDDQSRDNLAVARDCERRVDEQTKEVISQANYTPSLFEQGTTS
jgi:hypothetical protein